VQSERFHFTQPDIWQVAEHRLLPYMEAINYAVRVKFGMQKKQSCSNRQEKTIETTGKNVIYFFSG
jgi:hypothetical protein